MMRHDGRLERVPDFVAKILQKHERGCRRGVGLIVVCAARTARMIATRLLRGARHKRVGLARPHDVAG